MKTTKPGLYYLKSFGLIELKEWGDNYMMVTYMIKKNKLRRFRVPKARYNALTYIGQV